MAPMLLKWGGALSGVGTAPLGAGPPEQPVPTPPLAPMAGPARGQLHGRHKGLRLLWGGGGPAGGAGELWGDGVGPGWSPQS